MSDRKRVRAYEREVEPREPTQSKHKHILWLMTPKTLLLLLLLYYFCVRVCSWIRGAGCSALSVFIMGCCWHACLMSVMLLNGDAKWHKTTIKTITKQHNSPTGYETVEKFCKWVIFTLLENWIWNLILKDFCVYFLFFLIVNYLCSFEIWKGWRRNVGVKGPSVGPRFGIHRNVIVFHYFYSGLGRKWTLEYVILESWPDDIQISWLLHQLLVTSADCWISC